MKQETLKLIAEAEVRRHSMVFFMISLLFMKFKFGRMQKQLTGGAAGTVDSWGIQDSLQKQIDSEKAGVHTQAEVRRHSSMNALFHHLFAFHAIQVWAHAEAGGNIRH